MPLYDFHDPHSDCCHLCPSCAPDMTLKDVAAILKAREKKYRHAEVHH